MRGLLSSVAALCFAALSMQMVMAAETDIDLTTPTGIVHGTLTMPDKPARGEPLALIVAGSGPTNRDGSSTMGVSVTPYRQLAEALAADGIASVRYDKRGIAASAKSAPLGNPVTFQEYVDDVVAWVHMLRADKRFGRIVLVGHSEGSLLSLLAAKQVKVDGVASLDGAGRPAIQVLSDQFSASPQGAPYAKQVTAIATAIRDGNDPGAIPDELKILFPDYLRTFEQQWFAIDPAQASGAIASTPLLVVQGGHDIQVSQKDAELIAGGHPGATLRTFPTMNHVLMDVAGTDREANIAAYNDVSLKIDAQMAATVAAFVKGSPLPPTM
jgi:pimeloyl-ACP methyl ester carboxylesterase